MAKDGRNKSTLAQVQAEQAKVEASTPHEEKKAALQVEEADKQVKDAGGK